MNHNYSSFSVPIDQFDLTLLPENARQVGSEAFQQAVLLYFTAQYAEQQQTAIVSVDDQKIQVTTLPNSSDPMAFVMEMLQSGKFKEAIPLLEAISKSNPDDVDVFFNLGIAYSETGEYDQAIIKLKRAVKLAPDHSHALGGLGFAYQRMGELDLAKEYTLKAVEADPEDGYARRNLGGLLANLEQFEDAADHLIKAHELLPNDPQTIMGLASVLEQTPEKAEPGQSDTLYKTVINNWPASELAERARQAQTRIAQKNMRSGSVGELRPDVVMYISGALETFEKIGQKKKLELVMEISMLGQQGLNINDPEQKYSLTSLPGEFSAMHLVSIMYAGTKQIDPDLDSGIDLSAEYEEALAMK